MNELTRYNFLKEANIETTISKGAILNNIAGLSKSAKIERLERLEYIRNIVPPKNKQEWQK